MPKTFPCILSFSTECDLHPWGLTVPWLSSWDCFSYTSSIWGWKVGLIFSVSTLLLFSSKNPLRLTASSWIISGLSSFYWHLVTPSLSLPLGHLDHSFLFSPSPEESWETSVTLWTTTKHPGLTVSWHFQIQWPSFFLYSGHSLWRCILNLVTMLFFCL